MISHSPIFIGGLFKSGTTLLRSMIGQHSRIASGLETYWFDLAWQGPRDADFMKRIDWLATFYGISPEAMVRYLDAPSAEAFLDRLLSGYAEAEGKPRWAEKTPGNILHMDRILSAWPDARIVHIIRDPRDVFASLRQAKKWDTVEEFMSRWLEFLGTVETVRSRGLLIPESYLEIRYEGLVTEPEAVMREVIAFVGEPWEPAVGTFAGKPEEFEKVRNVTGKESSTLKRLGEPISPKRVAIWHDVLAPEEVEEIHRVAEEHGLGELMRSLEINSADD